MYAMITSGTSRNLVPGSVMFVVRQAALYRTRRWWSSLSLRCTSTSACFPFPRMHSASSRTLRPCRFFRSRCGVTCRTVSPGSSSMVCRISWQTSLSSAITRKKMSSMGLRRFAASRIFASLLNLFIPPSFDLFI